MDIELIEPEAQTALTAPQRAAVALSSAQTRADLAELVKKSAAILAVTNAAGRAECHSAAMALVKARTAIEKVGKAAREDAQAFSKAVIAEEKSLIGITSAEEDRLLGLRDGWDKARAAEKAEAERLERARVTGIHERIANIRQMAMLALECRTSAKVAELAQKTMAMPMDGFEEFEQEAITVRGEVMARLGDILGDKLADEAERARVKAEQEAEAVRLAGEREALAKERAENKRVAAANKAAADKLEAERAELERQRFAASAVDAELVPVELVPVEPVPSGLTAAPATVLHTTTEPAVYAPLRTVPATPKRPTDLEIIAAVAQAFGVPEPRALSWMIDLSVEAALSFYESATA